MRKQPIPRPVDAVKPTPPPPPSRRGIDFVRGVPNITSWEEKCREVIAVNHNLNRQNNIMHKALENISISEDGEYSARVAQKALEEFNREIEQ